MSFAVGTFCGLIPCIGQAYICFLFWLFFKKFKYLNFSLLISSALTFVTNPLVMPFVLYGYYSVGETIIGRPSLTLGDFAEEAKHLFENDPNFGSLLKNSLSFFVGDVGKPLAIGSIVCAYCFRRRLPILRDTSSPCCLPKDGRKRRKKNNKSTCKDFLSSKYRNVY